MCSSDLNHIVESGYDVRCFGYDPYNAKEFVERWSSENGPFGIEKVIQGAKTESVPLGELKKLSEERMLLFDEELIAIDKEAITKVLSNLLNNALKYARHTITIDLSQDEVDFTVRVVSDGEKIPESSSQQIFEPFYQLEKKKDAARMGVGIGLPLARSLATLHKGRLYLDIEQPENTFVLTIPLNKEEVRDRKSVV